MKKDFLTPKDRNLYLFKEVEAEHINELTKKIIEISEHDEEIADELEATFGATYTPDPIKLYIDSYGGYVYQCLGLIEVMKASKTPVHTIVTGCAMSCGFLIAVSGKERFAYGTSTFMYHQVSSGVWGPLKEIQEDVEETKRLQKIIEQITLSNTKMTKKQLEESFNTKKDLFFDGKKALKLGCIDKLL